jgi:hypothetical protein
MALDFNDVGPQRSFDVIPDGTIAIVRMKIRPGHDPKFDVWRRIGHGPPLEASQDRPIRCQPRRTLHRSRRGDRDHVHAEQSPPRNPFFGRIACTPPD